jgi:hypothetical protein
MGVDVDAKAKGRAMKPKQPKTATSTGYQDPPGSPPDRSVVTPKTFEQMIDDEVEEIMEERRRKQERPDWGRNEFGEARPLSAWDYI